MKIYTYSQAREKLADLLEESKSEEVMIRRRKGDLFCIVPKNPRSRSPFDVHGLQTNLTRKEILEAIRESRERVQ
jgi:antitoxin Phd